MKKLIISISAICIMFLACKKERLNIVSRVAGLNVVNATVGSSPLFYKFNNKFLIYSKVVSGNKISYGNYKLFSPVSGVVNLAVIQSTDTLNTLFQGSFNLKNANTYTLFLAGTVDQPDTLFVHDKLPFHSSMDSTAGIRFVNLSPGSGPVSVDIQGLANGSEVTSLAYKSLTGFKSYKADHTVGSYIFEFRDVATGNLLASYELDGVNNSTGDDMSTNTVRFKNMTIALIGQPEGGTVSQSAILVANY